MLSKPRFTKFRVLQLLALSYLGVTCVGRMQKQGIPGLSCPPLESLRWNQGITPDSKPVEFGV
eukprot:1144912-Pelagomonas_calceolata.AAC.2